MSNREWDLISYNQAKEANFNIACKEIVDYINKRNKPPKDFFEVIERERMEEFPENMSEKIIPISHERSLMNEMIRRHNFSLDIILKYYKKFETIT